MKIILVLLLSVFLSSVINAQNSIEKLVTEQDGLPELISKLSLKQDPRLTDMVERHIENNQMKKGIEGWKVEIFFVSTSSNSDARKEALKAKQVFMSMYPDIDVKIKFSSPRLQSAGWRFQDQKRSFEAKKGNYRNFSTIV